MNKKVLESRLADMVLQFVEHGPSVVEDVVKQARGSINEMVLASREGLSFEEVRLRERKLREAKRALRRLDEEMKLADWTRMATLTSVLWTKVDDLIKEVKLLRREGRGKEIDTMVRGIGDIRRDRRLDDVKRDLVDIKRTLARR